MIDANQIPFMLDLLNDESPDVRRTVIDNLRSFGPLLNRELKNNSLFLNPSQQKIIDRILLEQKEQSILYKWPGWIKRCRQPHALERGVILLSEFLNQPDTWFDIANELDLLAQEFYQQYATKDPFLLARFLFKDLGFTGNEEDFYNPQNCNLAFVMKEKKGIPVSLVTLYMLVGQRLELTIEGCNFPGHFLARVPMEEGNVFVDCYHYGDVINRDDIFRVKEDVIDGLDNILSEKVYPDMIMRRFLANLVRMYSEQNREDGRNLVIQLFKKFDGNESKTKVADLQPEDNAEQALPVFDLGQIVKHKRYGYRGVIVDFDVQCMASEDWYYGNPTQPGLFQPWYHILVDETEEITYVAESNLVADEEPKEIVHPLVSYFFSEFIEGTYIRNENPWPETEY